jgi:hypothetical protein
MLRRAGMTAANTATLIRMTDVAANVTGSIG